MIYVRCAYVIIIITIITTCFILDNSSIFSPEKSNFRYIVIRVGRLLAESSRRTIPSRDRPGRDPENDILYQWRLKRRLEQAQGRVMRAEQEVRLNTQGSPLKAHEVNST